MQIRNVAIIAHVDHGKTTIVDSLLKQSKTFRENEAAMAQKLLMDSNDQERERGITISAKNAAVNYNGTKINIIDTPGHSDFGGEVERTLNMADGALLIVDAQEGPMPQTKFVLKKALELNLKIIVIINKIDKPNSQIKRTLEKVSDLFLELALHEDQLDFPTLYAVGKDGKAWTKFPENFDAPGDATCIFTAIIQHIPAPVAEVEAPFQMLVSALDWDTYKGIYALGRVTRGTLTAKDKVVITKSNGSNIAAIAEYVYVNKGLGRLEVLEGTAGDIIAVTGLKGVGIGDTICATSCIEPLPTIKVEEPTLSITVGANTSPFMGKEGSLLTSRQILERIEKELQTNVAMRFGITPEGKYLISGRGELHLSVFLETLRREGFELEVSKPTAITKVVDGKIMEPIEQVTVDVDNEHIGAVKSEVGRRRGVLTSQEEITENSSRLTFDLTTRGTLGLRSIMMTLTKGTAAVSSNFIRYEKQATSNDKLRKGVLISSSTGKAVTYGLVVAHEKGPVFIEPQEMVYEGMIVGLNGRNEDLEINVCKEKQLSNVRSSGEEAIIIPPSVKMSLEQKLGFLEDDELLEITPKSLRLRKKILTAGDRRRASRK